VVPPEGVGDESGPSTTKTAVASFLDWIASKKLSPKRVADVKGRTTDFSDITEFYTYANWKGPPENDTTYFFTDVDDFVVYYYNDKSGFEFLKRISP